MRPASVTTPTESIAEMASTRPLPQTPTALPSPMTWTVTSPSFAATLSMAPGEPSMPQEISAPSKAGPAAVAQVTKPSALPRPISPLVPMSIYSQRPSAAGAPEATSPAVMSPPT